MPQEQRPSLEATRRRFRRRRGRDQEQPESSYDLDEVTRRVLDTAQADLGQRPRLASPPEPLLRGGAGPDAYLVEVVTEDPRWSGPLVARAPETIRPAQLVTPHDPTARRESSTSGFSGSSGAGALEREARWLRTLHELGFPAPEMVGDGVAHGILLQRVAPGVNVATCMITDFLALPRLLAGLGQLHARLHGLPVDGNEGATATPGDGADDPHAELDRRMSDDAERADLHQELDWLEAHRPTPAVRPVVCHGAFTPIHVYVEDSDPATALVVNWTRARMAEPAYDVAATVTAFWSVPLYTDNAVQRTALKTIRDSLISAYLKAYTEGLGQAPDDGRVRYWQAHHLASLALDLSHRHHHGPAGPWDPTAVLGHPHRALGEVRKRFRSLTTQPN